jgi:HD-GYP domain-containing protein (c-di-GMP phosphodiesterase class II)
MEPAMSRGRAAREACGPERIEPSARCRFDGEWEKLLSLRDPPRSSVQLENEGPLNLLETAVGLARRPSREDAELPAVHAQLVVFARELGELHDLERQRGRDLERALANLQETYVATMTSLARVVEAKDECTRGHLDRTTAYGMALARRVDPELAARPELAHGFFLHDIGKVGIPEGILSKAGSLDDGEWDVMRRHPTIGADIVTPIPFLAGAVDIIRHHHERVDGGGYPRGLKGRDIPLAARIFAVADSFDAMTSDRPYRGAFSTERALREIEDASGSQFDPDVVDEFLILMQEEDLVIAARDHAHVEPSQAGRDSQSASVPLAGA